MYIMFVSLNGANIVDLLYKNILIRILNFSLVFVKKCNVNANNCKQTSVYKKKSAYF